MASTLFTSTMQLASSCSSSRRGLQQRRGGAALPRRPAARVAARASTQQEREQAQEPSVLDGLKSNADMMLRRYDFLSAGLGALAVTTFCVVRGQDPATAIWITGASTVVALVSTRAAVLRELMAAPPPLVHVAGNAGLQVFRGCELGTASQACPPARGRLPPHLTH